MTSSSSSSSPPRWVIATALVTFAALAGITVYMMLDMRSNKDEDEGEKSEPFVLSGKSISLPHVRGRIDHMALDHAKHQLFVAALGNNSIEVVNTQTLQHMASINGIHEPRGLAFSNQTLFAASGGEGALRVIECSTGGFRQQSSVTIGDDADNVRVDYGREQLLVGYGGAKSGGIFVIDISRDACGGVYVTDSSCARINDMALPAHIESFQLSQHFIYANIPLLQEIHVLDRLSGATVDVRSVVPCQSNYSMALDLDGSRLFCACRGETPTLLVFSVAQFEERRTAQPALVELARLPLHADCDDLW